MCGRFYLDVDFDEVLRHYFDVIGDYPVDTYEPREIFPSNEIPVVHRGKKVESTIHLMKWGFAPSFMNKLLINARSETVFEKKLFKEAFFRRRCLIPASGYYEWEKKMDENNKIQKIKRSFERPDQKIFSMAGIYDRFFDEDGQAYWAVTILTQAATDQVKGIHDRMPLILDKDMERRWIKFYEEDYSELFKILERRGPELVIK